MADLRTFTCSNCGANIATSAPPGTEIRCEYCGTINRVPSAEPEGDEEHVRAYVPRGNPTPLPGPGHTPPPPDAPSPGSPADVGYTYTDDMPVVGRAPAQVEPGEELNPPLKSPDKAPTAADLIAEPTKHGAGIPSDQGEPVLVAPNRVTVVPPQAEVAGSKPGTAFRSRSPMVMAGAVLACCLVPTAIGALCVISGFVAQIFGQ